MKDTPGPGQYNPNSRGYQAGSKIGTSMRSDFTGGKDASWPGPGQHNATDWDVRSRQGKGSTFAPHGSGKTADRGKDLISNSFAPGPGQYTFGYGQGGPSYSMGVKFNDKDDNWQPAPGTYQPDISSIKGDPKAGLFGAGQRSNIAAGKKGPGPGAYNTTNYRGTDPMSYSIGASKRANDKDKGVPGPGHYHVPYYVADVPRYQMPYKPDEWRFV